MVDWQGRPGLHDHFPKSPLILKVGDEKVLAILVAETEVVILTGYWSKLMRMEAVGLLPPEVAGASLL